MLVICPTCQLAFEASMPAACTFAWGCFRYFGIASANGLTMWRGPAYFFFNGNSSLQKYAPKYLADAQGVYQDLVQSWSDTCGGGIWWKRYPASYPGNFKATNATLGLMEIAIGLYQATKKPDYLAWAEKCWNWIKQQNLIVAGIVVGGVNEKCQPDPKNTPVIALQGNPLGPLWQLYVATGDTTYLDVGQGIVEMTARLMIWPVTSGWPETAILLSHIDADWANRSQADREGWSGQTPFKGIFVGFLGEFVKNLATVQDAKRQQAAKQYASLLAGNAKTVASNFPGGLYGID